MRFLRNLFVTANCILTVTVASAQVSSIPTMQLNLQKHIRVLAHDSLEGRLVGSTAEAKAARYIISEFAKTGITGKGTDNYLQPFTFTRLTHTHSNNEFFRIEKNNKVVSFSSEPKEWPYEIYPLPISGVGNVNQKSVWVNYGIIEPETKYNDYKQHKPKSLIGKVFMMWHGMPEGSANHPHSSMALASSIEAKVDTAIKYGAAAVVLFAKDTNTIYPEFKKYTQANKLKSIPVLFCIRPVNLKLVSDANVQLQVDTQRVSIKGNNVIGYIDHAAENTIIIGAHYDHLGYNEFGSSTYRTEKNERPQIHNGADDNASGTAALMVLASELKSSKFNKHNYLFIAFSGEEEGLLGSNYFNKNPTIDLKKVNAMINMDMVGRLDVTKYTLGINGTGTSKEWPSLLEKVTIDSLKYKYTASGIGASDHTSFYYSNIPVLHYFTGTHYDYHKPSDDEAKINYDGAEKVVKHILQVVKQLNELPKLTFTPTKEDSASKVSFKVTLGIMPDYMYEGKGIKVDGVTPGRPAAIAGIKKDDIIIKLGDYQTSSMQVYMLALSNYKKGDVVNALILRDGKELVVEVRF